MLLRWLRWVLSLLLQPGGIPLHVALIMDGNRRFAAGHNIRKVDGHVKGYSKMVDAIHWCLELGVQYMTVYAFSIDNFSRSLEEVQGLMQLSEDKFAELMQNDGLAERKGVEIRILGDLSLAPPAVQGSAARLMQKTAALPAKQAVLNICFSYTSREELIHSMDLLRENLQSGALQQQDLSPTLLHRCLRTQASPPVDLLVRTSGETRLSDFLLWQAAHAQLEWVDCMWPDWGFLSFARCILRWQMHAKTQQHLRKCSESQLVTCSTASAMQQTALSNTSGQPQVCMPGLNAKVDKAGRQADEYMWELPSNWAPHRYPPIYHMLGQHIHCWWRSWFTPASTVTLSASQAPASVQSANHKQQQSPTAMQQQQAVPTSTVAQQPANGNFPSFGPAWLAADRQQAADAHALLSIQYQQVDRLAQTICYDTSGSGVHETDATELVMATKSLPCEDGRYAPNHQSSRSPSTPCSSSATVSPLTSSPPSSPRGSQGTPMVDLTIQVKALSSAGNVSTHLLQGAAAAGMQWHSCSPSATYKAGQGLLGCTHAGSDAAMPEFCRIHAMTTYDSTQTRVTALLRSQQLLQDQWVEAHAVLKH